MRTVKILSLYQDLSVLQFYFNILLKPESNCCWKICHCPTFHSRSWRAKIDCFHIDKVITVSKSSCICDQLVLLKRYCNVQNKTHVCHKFKLENYWEPRTTIL